jgi:hypothetical protein
MFELHITDVSRVVQQVIAPAFVLAGWSSPPYSYSRCWR